MIKVGEIYETNNYGTLEVIEYVNSGMVRVRFIDTGYEKYTQAGNIHRGGVKDLLAPSVWSVGYLGMGPYRAYIDTEQTKVYTTWKGMLERCYSVKCQSKHPTYKGCTVVETWHNFQVFAEWFETHYIEGYELDKDTLVEGNKVYGPDTCMFITRAENMIIARAVTAIFRSPAGEKYEVYNVAQFSREQGLHQGHLIAVKNGKRKTHKGWTKWPD